MDADAKLDAPPLGLHLRIARGHRLLHLGSATHRINNAREFDEHAIARRLNGAPVVGCDARIDQLAPQRAQCRERALLVSPDEWL